MKWCECSISCIPKLIFVIWFSKHYVFFRQSHYQISNKCWLSEIVSYCKIINVYDQKYESGARFWPDVHLRIIIGLIISQLLLMGLLNTKNASKATPLLLVLPVLTIWFHYFCKGRFQSAFSVFPLQVRVWLWNHWILY